MFDFHLDEEPEPRALVEAVAFAFGLELKAIRFVHSLAENISEDVALLCTRRTSAGEFLLHIAVYPQFPDLKLPAENVAAERLVQKLGCRCLIGADHVNPYTWLLLEGSAVQSVVVDSEALAREELSLERMH